jgi:replicative DNA helicase
MAKENVLPPNNIEAEEATLGSLLIDQSAMREIGNIITAQDFYVTRHGWIFDAVKECGEFADLLTVSDSLRKAGKLEDVGGESYLSDLMAGVPTALNARGYAEIVKDRSDRRKLIAAATIAAKGAYNLDQSVQVSLSETTDAINKVYSEAKSTGSTFPAALDDILEFINDDSPRSHIATGVGMVDVALKGGLLKGAYVVLGAAPGTGKTILAVQMLYKAMMSGNRALYYSFEVPRRAIVARLLAVHIATKTPSTPISYGAMIDRTLTPEQRNIATEAWLEICDAVKNNVMIFDPSTMTADQLTNSAISFAIRGGCDLVIVDQMHHMSDSDKRTDTKQRLSNISRELAKLPKRINEVTQLGMPLVLALARLNRGGYDKPALEALKESGDIESDAEMVMFMYKDRDRMTNDPTAATPIFINVAKNRNGPADFSMPALMMGSINRIGDAK